MDQITDSVSSEPEVKVRLSRSRLKLALSAHEAFVGHANRNVDFAADEQWSAADKAALAESGRPALTINRILPLLASIYGEFASMRSEFFFKGTRGGTRGVATKLSQVIRHILNENRYASDMRNDTFLDGIVTNRGFFVLSMGDDIDPLGGVQIENYDSRHVILPLQANKYDPSTWPEVFTVETWSRGEISDTFGEEKAEACFAQNDGDISDELAASGSFGFAFGEDTNQPDEQEDGDNETRPVIVHEFRTRRPVWRFVDANTQDVLDVPVSDMTKEEAQAIAKQHGTLLEKKQARAVKFRQFCGDILLREDWAPTDEFSVIPFFPYFIAGKSIGIVQPLISSQEQFNKLSSQELHIINTTANSGWQVEEGTLVSPTAEALETQGAKSGLVIVRRRGTSPLEKIQPNSIPTGIVQAAERASRNMQLVSNVNDGVLGHTGTNVAGKVVQEKKASMQASLQMVFDNFKRTEMVLARCIVKLIQAFYTETRVFRITEGRQQAEQSEAEVVINARDAAGAIVDDVSLGRYDVTVAFRPQQDVQNDAEFAEMVALREMGVAIPDHQIVARSHVDGAELIAKEMRIMAGLEQTPEMQEVQARQQQLAEMDFQLELAKKQAEVAKLEAETIAIYEKAGLDKAKAQDLVVGQNARFAAQLQASDIIDQRGSSLRDALSRRSADTAITSTLLRTQSGERMTAAQIAANMMQTINKEKTTTEKGGDAADTKKDK